MSVIIDPQSQKTIPKFEAFSDLTIDILSFQKGLKNVNSRQWCIPYCRRAQVAVGTEGRGPLRSIDKSRSSVF